MKIAIWWIYRIIGEHLAAFLVENIYLDMYLK